MKSKITKIALIIAAGAFTLSGLFAATDVLNPIARFKDIKVVNNSDYKVKLAFFDVKKNKKDLTVDAHENESKTLRWFGPGEQLSAISIVVVQDGKESAPMTSNISWNGSRAQLTSTPANSKVTVNASVDADPKVLDVTIDNAMASIRPVGPVDRL